MKRAYRAEWTDVHIWCQCLCVAAPETIALYVSSSAHVEPMVRMVSKPRGSRSPRSSDA